MLFPFDGFRWVSRVGDVPTASGLAASARSARDDAGRYQDDRSGWDAPSSYDRVHNSLLHYSMMTRGGEIAGCVGTVPIDDLRPHESLIESALRRPLPALEIRPVMAIASAWRAAPAAPTGGAPQSVTAGAVSHSIKGVDDEADPIETGQLIIADGHHRIAAALRDRDSGIGSGRILTLVIPLTAPVGVGTFHRVLRSRVDLERLTNSFEVTPLSDSVPVDGALVLVQGESIMALRPTVAALEQIPLSVRGSMAGVAAEILYPLVEIAEAEVEYTETRRQAIAAAGRTGAALLLPPMSIDAVVAAALGGTLLPPKATRFRPKPIRGLIMRDRRAD